MNDEGPAFVDTNVLVYAYDEVEDRRRGIAQQLLDELTAADRLRLSTQVLQEFYVTITRKVKKPLSPEKALVLLDAFSVWSVLSITPAHVREAVLLSTEAVISFWDALILIAAQDQGAATLYSEDLNAGQRIGGVAIVNPFS